MLGTYDSNAAAGTHKTCCLGLESFTAYENGAKYIVVFNYPKINKYGILMPDHFEALEKFWNKIQSSSQRGSGPDQGVLVRPTDYAWGMRTPDDTIWGFWSLTPRCPKSGMPYKNF